MLLQQKYNQFFDSVYILRDQAVSEFVHHVELLNIGSHFAVMDNTSQLGLTETINVSHPDFLQQWSAITVLCSRPTTRIAVIASATYV